ncbi:MAG: efflux RND transporter periplasmic adaptor subunit [Cellvibrio sp.]
MYRTITRWLIASLCFFSVSALASDESHVSIQQLRPAPITREVILSGQLMPQRNAKLSVAVNALVKTLYVDVGDEVKQGQVLAQLDDRLAQESVNLAKAQLKAAQIERDEAQRLASQAQSLASQQHIAATEILARQNAAKLAQAKVEDAQIQVSMARDTLERHQLRAPFAGVISARFTDLGQWLNPGDAVFNLVSNQVVFLDVHLPQEFIGTINQLTNISISPDAQSQLALSGRVVAALPVMTQARSFLLRLASEAPHALMVPGMSAKARLVFTERESAIALPRDALLRHADGGYSVFIVEDDKAIRRNVELGEVTAKGYRVKSGVAAGDKVVVRGNEILQDGQVVIAELIHFNQSDQSLSAREALAKELP